METVKKQEARLSPNGGGRLCRLTRLTGDRNLRAYKQHPTKAHGKVDSPWSVDGPIGHDANTSRNARRISGGFSRCV